MDELADVFMVALNQGQWKPDSPSRENQLEFVLTNIDSGRALLSLKTSCKRIHTSRWLWTMD